MTMKKSIVLSILSLTLCSVGIAQSLRVEVPVEYYRNQLRDGGLPPDVVGSPYDNETFRIGKVYSGNDKSYSAMMRYDAYRDNIEMQSEGKTVSLLKRDYISVSINEELYVIYGYEAANGSMQQGYFVQLTEGEGPAVFLKKKTKKLLPPEETTSTYKKAKPARFDSEESYYISLNNENAKKVKLNKKSIIGALGSSQAEITDFVKKNKLKLRSESDIQRVLDYYNSLQSRAN